MALIPQKLSVSNTTLNEIQCSADRKATEQIYKKISFLHLFQILKREVMDTDENLKEYRWETGYERTWEAITEDQSGGIEVSVQEMLQVNFNRGHTKRTFEC